MDNYWVKLCDWYLGLWFVWWNEKPVLIIHGSDDDVVNVSYSKRAIECYPNAELHVINGAGHGFSGESLNEAINCIIDFLK